MSDEIQVLSAEESVANADKLEDATATAARVATTGLVVLSEEQTNAALEALDEAPGLDIVKRDEDETVVQYSDALNADMTEAQVSESIVQAALGSTLVGSKRKDPPNQPVEEAPEEIVPTKRRAPVRVSWPERIALLKEYKEKHGNLAIPIRYKPNPALGKFIHNTREQYKLFHNRAKVGYKKKCSLTAERIKELDDLGFIWTTERAKKQNDDWDKRYEQLERYKAKHGDCLVPHGYEEDPSFAEWIHRQRTTIAAYNKSSKPNANLEERKKRLEDIGFVFTVHNDRWMYFYGQLKEYHEQHGHCNVPTHYAENPKLGRWVHTQRHGTGKNGRRPMNPERTKLLKELSFSWETPPRSVQQGFVSIAPLSWTQLYNEANAFYGLHNHFIVPQDEQPELYAWCVRQKRALIARETGFHDEEAEQLTSQQVETLYGIGFTKDTEIERISTAFSEMGKNSQEDIDEDPVQVSVPDSHVDL